MAAILCTTIGELISTACKALTIPCKACGAGCDKLGELICTPFMPYLVVTFFLNTPAVVYAIKSSVDQSWNCSGYYYKLFRWLIINAILSVIHMIAAFYIVNLIREEKPLSPLPITSSTATGASQPTFMATTGTATPTSEPTTTYQNAGNNSNNNNTSSNFIADSSYDVPGGPNSFQRIKHVLCYDKGMAVYILIFLFWIVWLAIGVSRRLSYDNGYVDNDYDNGCGDLTRYMNAAIAIGYVWMALVGTAFCCSLICLR